MNWREYNPSNENNPEDYIGNNHNLLLEQFTEVAGGFSNENNCKFAFTSQTINFMLPQAMELLGVDPDTDMKNLAYASAASSVIKLCDNSNIFLNPNNFSENYQNLESAIISTVNQLNVDNVEEIISNLRDVDSEIAEVDLSEEERTSLFYTNSIARYSSAYWAAELLTPESAWIDISNNNGGTFSAESSDGPPAWVRSDIKAAAIGAFFTANPFVALAGGAVSSAVDAALDATGSNY